MSSSEANKFHFLVILKNFWRSKRHHLTFAGQWIDSYEISAQNLVFEELKNEIYWPFVLKILLNLPKMGKNELKPPIFLTKLTEIWKLRSFARQFAEICQKKWEMSLSQRFFLQNSQKFPKNDKQWSLKSNFYSQNSQKFLKFAAISQRHTKIESPSDCMPFPQKKPKKFQSKSQWNAHKIFT